MIKRFLIAAALLCAFSGHSQTFQPILQPRQTFVDGSGSPCAGCSLFSYAAGTTTPHPTYTSTSGGVQNTNPVILDASGGASIAVDQTAYKFVLVNASGTTLWTVDQVVAPLSGNTGFLPLTGGTLTGALTLPSLTTTAAQAASITIPDRQFDCAAYTTIDACFAAAVAYVGTNESGSGHAIEVLLHDKTYRVQNPPLPLASGMTVRGVIPRITALPTGAWDYGSLPNGGTWIDCSGAATCMGATGNGLSGYANINLIGLGFQNWTGKMVSFGSSTTQGLMFGTMRDIYGIGLATSAASDRGFDIHNSADLVMDNVNVLNVNTGLYWANDLPPADNIDGGNSVISGYYVLAYPHSVALGNSAKPVYWLNGPNLLEFIRPQFFSLGGDFTADGILIDGTNQNFHEGDTEGSGLTSISIHDADLEGQMLNAVHIVKAAQNRVDIAFVGGDINAVAIDQNSENNIVDNAGGNSTAVAWLAPGNGNANLAFTNTFRGYWQFSTTPQGGITPMAGLGLYIVPGVPGVGTAGQHIDTNFANIFSLNVGGNGSVPDPTPGENDQEIANTRWVRTWIQPLYDMSGNQLTQSHFVYISGALVSGVKQVNLTGNAVFATTFLGCSVTDTTNPNPMRAAVISLSQVTIAGNASDSFTGICWGN